MTLAVGSIISEEEAIGNNILWLFWELPIVESVRHLSLAAEVPGLDQSDDEIL